MRYLSVCSGIEAATAAWHPLGWEAAAFSEIEAFPRAVLQHHYPETPLHGDFTTIRGDEYGPIDLLVGGTPCQSFSVAGLRGGLADDRGNLALEFLRLAQRTRARWLVWENVPGVLSSNGGRDFGSILGGLVELGYGFAYRVLDAQFFGVPQRRRRVFVVGHLGDWRRAAAVLFERHSLSGHPAPRREKGQETARSLRVQSQSSHREDSDNFVAETETWVGPDGEVCSRFTDFYDRQSSGEYGTDPVASTVSDRDYKGPSDLIAFDARQSDVLTYGDITGPMDCGIPGPAVCFTAKDYGADASDISPTLRSGSHDGSHANGGVMPAVAEFYSLELSNQGSGGNVGWAGPEKPTKTLDTNTPPGVVHRSAVRRLTPEECEALQGFPRGYTLIPYRGKPAADGPRYKALGNSMAMPVMRWIGERIAMAEAIQAESIAA